MDGKEIVRIGLAEYWDGLRKALNRPHRRRATLSAPYTRQSH